MNPGIFNDVKLRKAHLVFHVPNFLFVIFIILSLGVALKTNAQDSGICDFFTSTTIDVNPDYINLRQGYCGQQLNANSLLFKDTGTKFPDNDFTTYPTYASLAAAYIAAGADINDLASYNTCAVADCLRNKNRNKALIDYLNAKSIGPIFYGCSAPSCTLIWWTLLDTNGDWVIDNAARWQGDRWEPVTVRIPYADNAPSNHVWVKPNNTQHVTDLNVGRVRMYRGNKPTANAGSDIVVLDKIPTGVALTLDGSASTDANGIISYFWRGSDGSTYTGVQPNIIARLGNTEFKLTVMNAAGEIHSDTMNVLVTPATDKPPIANAGDDQIIDDDDIPGVLVQLDGSKSTDDGDSLGYAWEGSDGSRYFVKSPLVNAPRGTTKYTLVVTDSQGQASIDVISITVNPPEGFIADVPQQSIGTIITSNGEETTTTITIGSSSDGGKTYKTRFSDNETIDVVTKIYPQEEDVGKIGDIYVVLRVVKDGKRLFYTLASDGLWLLWNTSIKTLEPAISEKKLQSEEVVKIYSGTMVEGTKSFYVGYSVIDDASGKPVIHFNKKRFSIDVLVGRI